MRTQVTQTSRDAYNDLRLSGRMSAQQSIIVRSMAWGRDYTLQELASATLLPINVVSGRVNELRNAGLLEHAPKRKCSITRVTVTPVRLPGVDEVGA